MDDKTIQEAIDAGIRLNQFGAIEAMCENGLIPGGSASADLTASKIIKLAQAERQRQLRIMDRATGRSS